MARNRRSANEPKPRPDAYLGLVFLATLMMVGGAVILYLEYSSFPSQPGTVEPSANPLANPPPDKKMVDGKEVYSPGEKIQGKVTEATDSLVTFTIERGAGLAKDHTLELFSLDPKPTYLGLVRVTEVGGDTGRAQPLGRLTGSPKVGDSVASRLGP